jgi:hypothetical protein
MLIAYIDGSHNDDIEVVAGVVATEQSWAGFDDAWCAILDRYKLDHFHTTDYWARARPYNKLSDAEHEQLRLDICGALKATRAIAFGSIVWKSVYEKDVAMMEKSDTIIANLTPFAGASADAGTLIEVGWFLGKGKPIFGYSNTAENFESRMRKQLGAKHADLGIEGFHLPDKPNADASAVVSQVRNLVTGKARSLPSPECRENKTRSPTFTA